MKYILNNRNIRENIGEPKFKNISLVECFCRDISLYFRHFCVLYILFIYTTTLTFELIMFNKNVIFTPVLCLSILPTERTDVFLLTSHFFTF